MSTTEEIVIGADQGMVAYTDGGCDMFPRFIGSGAHGYLYQDIRPKKGAGIQTHVVTAEGYRSKGGEDIVEVVPTHYFDISAGRVDLGTNNIAELLAAAAVIDKALEFNIKRLHLVADSKYVLDGINEWSPSWIKNNWYKFDGTPVPNADLWKPLLSKIGILKTRGVQITYAWVRGHGDGRDDSFGNLMADALATIGKQYSANGLGRQNFFLDKADGHWKSDVDKHPVLCMRSMYFSTLEATQIKGEYYLGNQNFDTDLIGTRNSDGAYAVVQLKEPDATLELIRDHQSKLSGEDERLVRSNIGNAFAPETNKYITQFGTFALGRVKSAFPQNLYSVTDEAEITSVLDPQRISSRTFDCVGNLRVLLNAFNNGEFETLTRTNINSYLYAAEVKPVTKGKKVVGEEEVITLRPELNVGFVAMPVQLNVKDDDKEIQVPVTLTLGMDLPDRNTLKRLETMHPDVTVITWKDAPGVFRYATVINCDGASSIWCGYYSNIVFLTEAMKAAKA